VAAYAFAVTEPSLPVFWIACRAMLVTMPRDGAIIFADLIGKLDVLNVACEKCSRAGRYRLQRLIDERDRNAKIVDWLSELT
jgi:hypothetical protein